MKLGIIGSSFSVGSHKDPDTNVVLAKPFESWFGDLNIINSACAGKGTELYLNKVLYLKKQHNIDTLLMEVINNRSMLNVKTQMNSYKVIWEESNIDNIINDVYKDSRSMFKYQRYLHQDIDYKNFGTEKQFKIWKQYQESIAADCTMNEFWALCDIKQTIDLCKLLGIRVITWAHSWQMEQIPVFESVIKNAEYIKFDKFFNAYDYYENKYGKENIRCDLAHFNDEINEEMIRDFILPKLKKGL
jgi:hypothetical protein